MSKAGARLIEAAKQARGMVMPREPNGRRSRKQADQRQWNDMTEAEAKSVAIEARVRHGVPRALADLADAGRANPGTLHGKMRLRGMLIKGSVAQDPGALTADQFAAAEWFLGRRLAYLRLVDAPGRTHEPPEKPGEGGGGVTFTEANAEWAKVMRVLQDASTEHRSPIIAAVDTILVKQTFASHMVGDLRLGLNAIHRACLAGQRRAA